MMKYLIIFGAPDAEERAARRIALTHGHAVATATYHGVPVHAGTAYKADGHRIDTGDVYNSDGVAEYIDGAIIFECSPAAAAGIKVVHTCDHHRPGDPGYGKGPEEFWQGSSLGQLCDFFKTAMTPYLALIAAGDHCPAAAYAGSCPGIGFSDFWKFRIRELAKKSGESPLETEESVRHAASLLKGGPLWEVVPSVTDVRTFGEISRPHFAEAALSMGKSYVAQIPELDREGHGTGRQKLVVEGNNSPDDIRAAMEWMKQFGEPYGVPERGFCGVVVAIE